MSSGSTSAGCASMRSSAASRPAALVATISTSDRLLQARDRAGVSDEVAERHAADAQPALGDRRGGGLPGDDHRRRSPARSSAPATQPADPARARARAIAHGDERQRIDEHAGVHDARGIDRGLGAAQGGGERLGALAVIPGPVIAPDGVVVGDGGALGDDRLGDGAP